MGALDGVLAAALDAARAAGRAIVAVRDSQQLGVETKDGGDPVGRADLASNRLLCPALVQALPGAGLLSEERLDALEDPWVHGRVEAALARGTAAAWCWVVDPLDGTRDFIADTDDFGVNIGLLHHGQPVLGVNHYPAHRETFMAVRDGGAWLDAGGSLQRLRVSERRDPATLRMLCSRSRRDRDFERVAEAVGVGALVGRGSMGLKLATIAAGRAELTMTLSSRSHLWDSCSGEVILHEAGGRITRLDGAPIDYRQPETPLAGGTLASHGYDHERLLGIVRTALGITTPAG